ncbi:MAG: hypothetical protein JSR64_22160 [Nitrospira sp.]|nr:hypothetical protein [Nitrospira sp.]
MADPKYMVAPVTVNFVDTGPAVSQSVPVTSANPLPVNITGSSGAGTTGTNPLYTRYGIQTSNPFTRTTINITTATTTAVVSATAAQITRVYRVFLNFGGSQTLDIQTASTSLVGGPLSFQTGSGLVLDFMGEVWVLTNANEALNFVTTTTAPVRGFIDYFKF